MFDRVLTDLHPDYSPLFRIDGNENRYEWVSAEGDIQPQDYNFDDFEERYEAWARRRTLIPPTVPKEGHTSAYNPATRQARCSVVGETVQVIVKLANIHLTPEMPEYGGGSWHVEGMQNEHIIAPGIYYYDSENITESTLAFRTAISFTMEQYEQGDEEGVRLVWGLDHTYANNQVLGAIKTVQGRCIAFSNT
ncbi:hypothetical protein FRB95_008178 [Tulasnella sp. JGI-2019a]|nr:hypothetical protein FRB95_008178 [Tulasnella sp. JGI-2019a]